MRATITAAGLALATVWATPALAQYYDPGPAAAYDYPAPAASFPIDRALAERCGLRAGMANPWPTPVAYYDEGPRRRHDGLGGALIGGAAGGVLGNRIAGHGHRTVGTVAGAAIGAAAGAAIDRAGDPEPRADYLEPGAAYADDCASALPPGYRLVSVPGAPECHDEVTTHEEWVPEYVTVPGTPRRAPALRDKRTKLRRVK